MNAIAAVSADWGLGQGNRLLFHIPEDLKRFRALTSGGTVIMGRKTLDSLPGGRPLPGRRNIVLTRDPAFAREGAEAAHAVEEVLALTAGADPETVWVCGGGEIYRLLLPFCRVCYLTRVFASPDSDTFFPNLEETARWRAVHRGAILSQGGLDYQFAEYEQVRPTASPLREK